MINRVRPRSRRNTNRRFSVASPRGLRWVAVILVGGLCCRPAGAVDTWQAEPASQAALPRPSRCRVVDYGDDYAFRYGDQYGWSGKHIRLKNQNVDGNDQDDDSIHALEFSLTRPLNPVFPWDPEGTNARFFGGLARSLFELSNRNRPIRPVTKINHSPARGHTALTRFAVFVPRIHHNDLLGAGILYRCSHRRRINM